MLSILKRCLARIKLRFKLFFDSLYRLKTFELKALTSFSKLETLTTSNLDLFNEDRSG